MKIGMSVAFLLVCCLTIFSAFFLLVKPKDQKLELLRMMRTSRYDSLLQQGYQQEIAQKIVSPKYEFSVDTVYLSRGEDNVCLLHTVKTIVAENDDLIKQTKMVSALKLADGNRRPFKWSFAYPHIITTNAKDSVSSLTCYAITDQHDITRLRATIGDTRHVESHAVFDISLSREAWGGDGDDQVGDLIKAPN